jgi:hypothetical protein
MRAAVRSAVWAEVSAEGGGMGGEAVQAVRGRHRAAVSRRGRIFMAAPFG